MFKMYNMFSNIRTPYHNRWFSHSISNMEDFAEDSKEEEEASDEEEDEVMDQSSVIIVGYLGTIRGNFHTCSYRAHLTRWSIILSKIVHT